MLNYREDLVVSKVFGLVGRLLKERSIFHELREDDDLREVGLSSLDMVSLVLAVESVFDLAIPEGAIKPANFRSVTAISGLVASLLNTSQTAY